MTLTDSLENQKSMTTSLSIEARKLGLIINGSQTKILNTDGSMFLPSMEDYRLRSSVPFAIWVTRSPPKWAAGVDINRRINLAWAMFKQLSRLWHADLNLKIQIRVLKACILTTASYACEKWNTTKSNAKARRGALHEMSPENCAYLVLRPQYKRQCHKNVRWNKRFHISPVAGSGSTLVTCCEWRRPANRQWHQAEPDPDWKRPRGGVKLSYERIVKKKAESKLKHFHMSQKTFEKTWQTHLTSKWRQYLDMRWKKTTKDTKLPSVSRLWVNSRSAENKTAIMEKLLWN